VPLEVEDFVGCGRQAGGRPYLFDEAVANKKTTIGNFPLMVIHGNDVGVLDE
jgi:hypothetical protein